MEGYYASYKCKACKKDTILITEEVNMTLASRKYISCSHCGSRNIKEQKKTDNLKECMDHAAYKKVHGAIRQVRNP